MHEAGVQQLDQIAVEEGAAQLAHVGAGALVQLLARHPFGDEERVGGELPVGAWSDDAVQSPLLHLPLELGGVHRLRFEVHLGEEPDPPIIYQAAEVGAAGDAWAHVLEELRNGAKQEEVQSHSLQNPRPLHLHGDLGAAIGRQKLGLVDLAERGCRDRGRRDGLKHCHGVAAKLLGHNGQGGFAGEGLHAVLQLLDLCDVLGRKKVAAGGEGLRQLDVCRPQPLHQQPQLVGALGPLLLDQPEEAVLPEAGCKPGHLKRQGGSPMGDFDGPGLPVLLQDLGVVDLREVISAVVLLALH
mmetsp:Transcript_6737/g.18856  ORF Transcript_6737/g.18856 Transcript_6737/m.18856 type:complete len:299 (+) Transcript_6737:1887-2783(+)